MILLTNKPSTEVHPRDFYFLLGLLKKLSWAHHGPKGQSKEFKDLYSLAYNPIWLEHMYSKLRCSCHSQPANHMNILKSD